MAVWEKVGSVRITILDGFRGYFLVGMLLNHLPMRGTFYPAKLSHSQFGFVEDAQGFVFLSGLILALTASRTVATRTGGYDRLARHLRWRSLQLYLWTALLIAAVTLTAALAPGTQSWWPDAMPDLYRHPWVDGPAALLLAYHPKFCDLLEQYALYLLAAPLIFRAAATGRTWKVALVSGFLWLGVQLGWHEPLEEGLIALLHLILPHADTNDSFNPLAWQLLFVGGLLVGRHWAAERLDCERLFPRDGGPPLNAAVGVLLLCLCYRLAKGQHLLPGLMGERFAAYTNRNELSLTYLVNFIALAYSVTWLLLRGADSTRAATRWLARALHRLLTLPALTLLGRHSLQVYVFHVGVAYAVIGAEHAIGPFNGWQRTGIGLLAVAALFPPALAHEAWQRRRRAAAVAQVPRRSPISSSVTPLVSGK